MKMKTNNNGIISFDKCLSMEDDYLKTCTQQGIAIYIYAITCLLTYYKPSIEIKRLCMPL